MRRWLAACVVALLFGAPAPAQTPTDVPPEHWAYQAVRDLAAKGLVLGYPDDRFLGDRTLTRYEMATIIKRVVDRLSPAPRPPGGPPGPPGPPGPAGPPGGVSPEEAAQVRRLVEEFKTELTVIGTDLKAAQERLNRLEEKLNSLEEIIRDPEGKLETVVSQVNAIRRTTFSGYVQARYEAFENSEEGSGTMDRFTIRRARLVTAARPSPSVGVRLQFDVATDAGNPPTSASARNTVGLRDAWIDWYPWKDPLAGPTLTIGQMKWPFGFEVVQSSGVRETPERARVTRVLFTDERDRGLKIASTAGRPLQWEVGVFNGTGINTNDNNFEKDIVGRLRYSFSQMLDVGVSGYFGTAFVPGAPASGATPATPAQEFVRNRYGADFQLFLPGIQFRGEYIQARERGRDPWGWIAQLNYNVGQKNVLVAKYDEFDDDNDASATGKFKTWNLGLIRYLDPSLRLKLFYELIDQERSDVDDNVFRAEFIANF